MFEIIGFQLDFQKNNGLRGGLISDLKDFQGKREGESEVFLDKFLILAEILIALLIKGFGVWGLGFGVWGLGDRKSVV